MDSEINMLWMFQQVREQNTEEQNACALRIFSYEELFLWSTLDNAKEI